MDRNSARQAVSPRGFLRWLLPGLGIPTLLLLAILFVLQQPTGPATPAGSGENPSPTHRAARETPSTPIVPPQEIVATVNGTTLSATDFEQIVEMDTVLSTFLGGNAPTQRAVLEQWINRTLILLAAPPAEKVAPDAQMVALLARRNLREDDLIRSLTAAGIDETFFRSYFQDLLQVQSVAPASDLVALQRAAHISFGPRAATIFAEEAATPISTLPTAGLLPTPAPTPEPTAEVSISSQMTGTATPQTESPPPAVEMRGTAPGLLAPHFVLSLLPTEISAAPTQTISFADLPGTPTLLSFWTTWCPYCRQQTPLLVDAYQRYADKGLRFLGVDVKEDAALVQTYVQNAQIPYPNALDLDGAVAEEFSVRGFPTTYFLDAEGRVVARHVGQLTTELIDDYIKRLLPTTTEEGHNE